MTPKLRGASLAGVLWHLLPGALSCLVFAAVGIVHVTSRVMVVDAGYRLSRLEQHMRELTLENDRLKLEQATLRAPRRLEKIAREQLKMAPPTTVLSLATHDGELARR